MSRGNIQMAKQELVATTGDRYWHSAGSFAHVGPQTQGPRAHGQPR